nr:MAG: ORF2 [Torque teno polar bear virus 10]
MFVPFYTPQACYQSINVGGHNLRKKKRYGSALFLAVTLSSVPVLIIVYILIQNAVLWPKEAQISASLPQEKAFLSLPKMVPLVETTFLQEKSKPAGKTDSTEIHKTA